MALIHKGSAYFDRLQTTLSKAFPGSGWVQRLSERPPLLLSALVLLLVIFSVLFSLTYLCLRDGRKNLDQGYYKIAYYQYYRAARAGDKHAQTLIGNLTLLGLGVKEDQLEAARWYLKAAMKGHVPAQINLGQLYWNGLGVPRRVGKAVGWFYLAKQAGSERAEGHLNYIGQTNSVLPLMFDTAVLQFNTLDVVKARLADKGEMTFLME